MSDTGVIDDLFSAGIHVSLELVHSIDSIDSGGGVGDETGFDISVTREDLGIGSGSVGGGDLRKK